MDEPFIDLDDIPDQIVIQEQELDELLSGLKYENNVVIETVEDEQISNDGSGCNNDNDDVINVSSDSDEEIDVGTNDIQVVENEIKVDVGYEDLLAGRYKKTNKKYKHKKGKKLYYCGVCDKNIQGGSYYMNHMRGHDGLRRYSCAICAKAFMVGWHLKEHLKTHAGTKDFQCDICKNCFGRKADLKVHLRRIHKLGGQFQCEYCKITFNKKQSLTQHMKIHLEIKEFHCSICVRYFSVQSALKKHIREHKKNEIRNVEQR